MNLSVLSLRAASRTPCSPLDLRLIRPGVRAVRSARCSSWHCFPGRLALSSVDYADGSVTDRSMNELSAPSLFADVAGTTDSSEFSFAFMSAVPSETFADRSIDKHHRCSWPMETKETSRFSRLESPRMHRFSDSAVFVDALPIAASTIVAFSKSGQDRHTEVVPCFRKRRGAQ